MCRPSIRITSKSGCARSKAALVGVVESGWRADRLLHVHGWGPCYEARVCAAPHIRLVGWHVRFVPILLQKSQIAERQFFRQKTRQEVIAD
jgi:hypothetical protein